MEESRLKDLWIMISDTLDTIVRMTDNFDMRTRFNDRDSEQMLKEKKLVEDKCSHLLLTAKTIYCSHPDFSTRYTFGGSMDFTVYHDLLEHILQDEATKAIESHIEKDK